MTRVAEKSWRRGGRGKKELPGIYISSYVGIEQIVGALWLSSNTALRARSRIGASVLTRICEGRTLERRWATAGDELRGEITNTVISARNIPKTVVK